MPSVLYDADIAGAGVDSLVSGHVWVAACFVDTPGSGYRPVEPTSDGHILRAGWVSFGSTLAVIGGVTRNYWRAVWWLDFLASLYSPDPSTDSSGAALALASDRVQWYLPPGGHAHLWVLGS